MVYEKTRMLGLIMPRFRSHHKKIAYQTEDTVRFIIKLT